MGNTSFKERVKNVAIENALVYKNNLMQYEYLVCSKAFKNGYHIVKADKGNYLHLIGIHTELSPDEFFEKCMASGENQLKEDDFDFVKQGKSEKSVKGSVREKISVLPLIENLFQQKLFVEDEFKKNNIDCAFAATDNSFTLGFVSSGRPKSLLKGNELDKNKQSEVDLVFRRIRGIDSQYEELIYGDEETVGQYKDCVKDLVAEKLLQIATEL